MLDADEREELRSLQARVYGRDAAVTAADELRLRELEDRRLVRPPVATENDAVPTEDHAAEAPTPEVPLDDDEAADVDGVVLGEGDDDAAAEVPPANPAASLRSLVRERWRTVAVAVATVLVIGLGIGWLAFGRLGGGAPVELTAEQRQWQNDLISGGQYDSGSVHALAVEEGAVIWAATKNDRERTCLIIGTKGVVLPSCELTEKAAETGIYGSLTLEGEGEVQRQLSVQMLFTAAGDPAVAVSSYDYDPMESGITYANDDEARIAKRLIEEGFDANSIWIVGYDGDVPVWSATKTESMSQCLIYDGATAEDPMACIDPETMQDQASNLVLNVVDTATGGVTHLEMGSSSGPSYLVITREGGVEGAGED